jgi:hypothetical protein
MRKENWASLLSEYIEKNMHKPFKRGSHDCAMFAVNCAHVMTGKDYAGDLRQVYKSREQAMEVLKGKGFIDLEQVATDRLGEPYVFSVMAKRGDCVSVHGTEGAALAIVDLSGKQAVTTGKKGLEFHPMKSWVKAWSIE